MSALAKMMGGGKKPKEKPVVTMPDENDPAVLAAGAKQVNSMRGVGGRDSTLMSVDQDGTGRERERTFGSTTLGAM